MDGLIEVEKKFCIFFEFLQKLIHEKNWKEDDIFALTQKIIVRYSDGKSLSNSIDFNSDNSIIDEIDLVYNFGEMIEKYLYFRDYNAAITFINTDNISMIELPLVQTEAVIYQNQEKETRE